MDCEKILFSGHAVRRMFDRSISPLDVVEVIRAGEIITDYLEDKPFPSYLLLGFIRGRPLHVVVAVEDQAGKCYIVTAYDPDPDLWEPDFRTRRAR